MKYKTPKQVRYEVDLIDLSISIVQDHKSQLEGEGTQAGLIFSQASYISSELETYERDGEMNACVFQSASNLFSNFCAQHQDEKHRFIWGVIDDELRRIASEVVDQ